MNAATRLAPALLAASLFLPLAAGCGGGERPQPGEAPADSAAPSPAPPAAAGPPGALSGRITFTGTPQRRAPITVSKDREVCGAHPIQPEDLIVGKEAGVQNAVVEILGAPKRAGMGASTPELHQRGCVFSPHVSLIPAGAPLAVFNDDEVLHNIHTFSSINAPFNRAQPKFQKRIEVRFDHPETIKVACDAHPWMSAWLVVTDHPHVALSDASGAFRIDGVPAGSYQARVWHEKLGERLEPVAIAPGQEAILAVELR
jgi:plastocyanin